MTSCAAGYQSFKAVSLVRSRGMTYSCPSSFTAFLSPDSEISPHQSLWGVDASCRFLPAPGRPVDGGSLPFCLDASSRADNRRDHSRDAVAVVTFERSRDLRGSRDDDDALRPAQCPECRSKKIGTLAATITRDTYWRCHQCGIVWNEIRYRQLRQPRW